jgi:phosphoglycolate phosphatase
MTQPLAVFDLDGTLVDTAPDLIDTLNLQFAREGLAPVEFDAARKLIGGGIKRLIERALTLRSGHFSDHDVGRMYAEYLDHYAAHIADRSRPFPGLEGALDDLAAAGWRLAVCTNKLEWLSVRLLDALGLTARFALVCGQDTFGVQKPDPEILRRTIAAAGGHPATSVMIGDSGTDIATARAAGIPVIVVDFGYSEIPVGELAPDRLINHYDELAGHVKGILSGPSGAAQQNITHEHKFTSI